MEDNHWCPKCGSIIYRHDLHYCSNKLPKQAQEGLKAYNELLTENQQYLSQQLKEAHDYLDKLKVPTNGVDANGNVGVGKRENLTLSQRLTYLLPSKAVEGLEKLGEKIGDSEWDELHYKYIRADTKLLYWDWVKQNYYPPKLKEK